MKNKRWLAIAAILLIALNMRAPISTVSPIAETIAENLGLTTGQLAIIGMLPPIVFALFGILASPITRRFSIETIVLLAAATIVLGHLGRAFSHGWGVFLLGSVVVLGGVGVANVVLPALIKRYAPTRIPQLTAITTATFAIGTSIPAWAVYPLATHLGWRFALGIWGITAALSLPAWLYLWSRSRPTVSKPEKTDTRLSYRHTFRSRTAWAIGCIHAVASFELYTVFAWFPLILTEWSGLSPAEASTGLALFAAMGLVVSLLVGAIVPHLREASTFVHVGVGMFVIGLSGLLLAPQRLVFVCLALVGLGPILYQMALTLIGLKTKSSVGAATLSITTQSFGFAVGALGPLSIGLLRDLTGSWMVPLIVLLIVPILASFAAFKLKGLPLFENE